MTPRQNPSLKLMQSRNRLARLVRKVIIATTPPTPATTKEAVLTLTTTAKVTTGTSSNGKLRKVCQRNNSLEPHSRNLQLTRSELKGVRAMSLTILIARRRRQRPKERPAGRPMGRPTGRAGAELRLNSRASMVLDVVYVIYLFQTFSASYNFLASGITRKHSPATSVRAVPSRYK